MDNMRLTTESGGVDDAELTDGDCGNSSRFLEEMQQFADKARVWNDSRLFKEFVCGYVLYEENKSACESVEAWLVLALACLGLLGAALTVLTFCRKPFVTSEVYLYRMVGAVETLHMAVMTLMHAVGDCHVYYVCAFFSVHVYMTVTNGCAEAVEVVVLFLSVERTVACALPQYFHRIHRMSSLRLAAALAVLSALSLNLVHAFDYRLEFENQTGRYRENRSEFAFSGFYEGVIEAQLVRFCVVGPLLILATVGSLIGLQQAVQRKRRLCGDQSLSSSSSRRQLLEKSSGVVGAANAAAGGGADRASKEIKLMIDMCCLQLCLAVPIVINYILCVAERVANESVSDRNRMLEEAFTMSYEKADSMLRRANMLEYLRFSISVTHMLAHGLHFYLYLLFSDKFRQTFLSYVVLCRRRARDATFPSTNSAYLLSERSRPRN